MEESDEAQKWFTGELKVTLKNVHILLPPNEKNKYAARHSI